MKNTTTRRGFIKQVAATGVGLTIGGMSFKAASAKSYANIMGSNERVNMAVMGTNGRGAGMEEKALAKGIAAVKKVGGNPKTEKDIRKILEDKNIDAILVTAPDHWHAPATIMACQAGKHVYCEKPCSHNPHEGELSLAAARKYNRVVQVGAQRRSWPGLTEGIEALHNGVIGKVHFAEALNNGTHEIDVVRWGLGLDFPTAVSSEGGRFRYKDDWETPDTQTIDIRFGDDCLVTWEGRSCNSRDTEGGDRGVIFYGEGGALETGHNGYRIFDMKNKLVKELASKDVIDGRDPNSPSANLDMGHIADFIDAIKTNRRPNGDIEELHKSTLLVQLGNIAWRTGHRLMIDPANGHIVNDPEAQRLWSRTYEPGWEPIV